MSIIQDIEDIAESYKGMPSSTFVFNSVYEEITPHIVKLKYSIESDSDILVSIGTEGLMPTDQYLNGKVSLRQVQHEQVPTEVRRISTDDSN